MRSVVTITAGVLFGAGLGLAWRGEPAGLAVCWILAVPFATVAIGLWRR